MTNQPITALLEVSNLKTYFYTEGGVVKAVDGIDLTIQPREVLGLVGESGCGKTVTALSIMRLIRPPGRIVAGEIRMGDIDLRTIDEERMRSLRGEQLSMIFQQPQSSLNPVISIGDQLAEVYEIHEDLPPAQRWKQAVELLHQVGIPDAAQKAHAYPHELSGGQAQRVMIAMALAMKPELLIADEPTTALDVTIQAQILDLIAGLREQTGTAVILITHDLGIVAETADRVAVMYAGQIVEQAEVAELFYHPLHPYTQGLIASIPILGERKNRLAVIPGVVPNLVDLPPGCRFAPRCQVPPTSECFEAEPALEEVRPGHYVRCWLCHAWLPGAAGPAEQ